jgi:hypothetical protein
VKVVKAPFGEEAVADPEWYRDDEADQEAVGERIQ